jgi:membrane protease YdiL (CAAX protease family)
VKVLVEAERPCLPPSGSAAWGPRDIILALGLAFGAGFVLVSVIVAPVSAVAGSNDDPAVLAAGLVATILFDGSLFGAAAYFSIARYRCSWDALGLGPPIAKELWPGIATAVGGQVIVGVYSGLVQLIGLDKLLPGTNVPEAMFEQRLLLPLVGIATVLVAPLAEETFFRGFMFTGLRRYGFFWAALASGLLFSAAHINPGGLIPLALVGMLFAWSYARSGSLWTSIYAHLTFNLVSFVALTAIVQSGGSF